jgi:hypothetical protein
MTTTAISRVEREELRGILKGRAKLAKKLIEQRAAQLLADAEQQLAAVYAFDAEVWKDLTANALETVKRADAELARRCRALSIPAEFRPKLALDWYSRGENAAKDRRTELRRVAVTRINAMAKEAQVQMETKALDGLELLARTALESAEAQRFLASIPTVEVLMPALDVAQLGPLALSQSDPDDELDIETPPVDDEE